MKKKIISCLLALLMILGALIPNSVQAAISINKTNVYLLEGKTETIKVKGTKNTVKWSSSKTSVATVKNGKITAKSQGKSTITAKVGKKSYTCKVTVYNTDETITESYSWVVNLWNEYLVNIRDSIIDNGSYGEELLVNLEKEMKKETYYKNFYDLLKSNNKALKVWDKVIEQLDFMYNELKDGGTNLKYADDFGYLLFDFMDVAYQ